MKEHKVEIDIYIKSSTADTIIFFSPTEHKLATYCFLIRWINPLPLTFYRINKYFYTDSKRQWISVGYDTLWETHTPSNIKKERKSTEEQHNSREQEKRPTTATHASLRTGQYYAKKARTLKTSRPERSRTPHRNTRSVILTLQQKGSNPEPRQLPVCFSVPFL